jgi:hypothetical protein
MAGNSRSASGRLVSADYTLKQNMEAFDKLPKSLREALRESAFNWSAASIRRQMRTKKVKAAEVIEIMHKRDRENVSQCC